MVRIAKGGVLLVSFLGSMSFLAGCRTAAPPVWRVHDMNRPLPPRIHPAEPGKAPSDAVVLFDGKDLAQWTDAKGKPAKWKAVGDYFEVVPGTGSISTKQAFGDCQLHLEWATPRQCKDPHDAGNSGVMIMGLYEVQVFDSWTTDLYADGAAAAIYGQYPPQVNATREPGKWQTYDIIWHAPRFGPDAQLQKPANITVLHNGVLVQDHVEPWGPIRWMCRATYEQSYPEKLPLTLQDHGNPVRYRNIWLRELPKGPQGPPPAPAKGIPLSKNILEQYVGHYGQGFSPVVEHHGQDLRIRIGALPWFDLVAKTETLFVGTDVAVEFQFDRTPQGVVKGLWWHHSGVKAYYPKVNTSNP